MICSNRIPLWIAFDGEIEESPKGKAKLKDNASEMAIQYFFREQASLKCKRDILTNAKKTLNIHDRRI